MPARSSDAGPAAVTTESEEQTRRLGEAFGRLIQRPLAIYLIGPLGCGKTMFAQGLARGLGVPAEVYVTSPSYTLINEYPGRLPLFHIDLYRLEAGFDPAALGLPEILAGDGVAAVEWADKLPADAAPDRLEIRFGILDRDRRTLTATAYGQTAPGLLKAFDSSAAGR
jgi:tRNA threonylcarbamoyladenosine biosynthesis protein TsaE